MKKELLKLAFVVMFVTTLVSCKKENTLSDSVSNNSLNDTEFVASNMEGQLRQMPYGHIIAALAQEYGCCFDFNNYTTATTPQGVTAANLIVVPSLVFDDDYLTIVINGSAQVLGVYEVFFTSGFNSNSRNEESNSYSFEIYYLDALFSGYVYTNVPNYPDRIYASGALLSYYPYPLLNYYSTGYINLENYASEPLVMTPQKMALKLASSFYIHYYLGN